MRLSQFSGKEIIDLDQGERLGMVGQADLVIDQQGYIESLLLPGSSFLGMGKKREEMVIPWHAIQKIGPEMIIIQLRQRRKVRGEY